MIGRGLLLWALLPWPAVARSQDSLIQAVHVSGAIRLDGRLDEPAWTTADSITDFRQREPSVGAAATERTVVKLLRDDDALYIAVRAFDREPAGVRSTQLRRDADLESDDNVTLLIDSFHDRRTGFVFATNPNGAMWDAQIAGLDEQNTNWNGIWEVTVTRDSAGWTAEFRIPFRTLRYNSGSTTTFGFNVRRFIRRKNEEVLWRSYGRAEGLYHQLREGEIAGLGELRRPTGVEVWPYVLGQAIEAGFDTTGTQVSDGGLRGKAGVDAKLGVTPTLTADVTLETDFAQVEADQQVINLTRFPLFFPEKREFFLESSGVFDFGTTEQLQLFYSRRVGLDTTGSPVPIIAGARLHGKAGPWTLGFLDARTGGTDQANDAVFRVQHDLFDRSYVGVMGIVRSGPGVVGTETAGGFDIDLPLVVHGQNVEPKFYIAATQTPSAPGTQLAWRVSTDYPNDLFDVFASLYRIDAGFNPTLGFVRRTGISETSGHVDFMPRPHVLGIRQLDIEFPIPSWDIIAPDSGSLGRSADWETGIFEWQPLGGAFQSGAGFGIKVQRFLDAPADSFELFPGASVPAGRYWWTRGAVEVTTSPAHPFSAFAQFSWGGFYNGNGTEEDFTLLWRGGGHLSLQGEVARNEIALPGSHFTAVQTAGRVEYAFGTRSDLLVFVQYNNQDQRVDFNFRFHWIPVIGDDVFVVWNSGYATSPRAVFRFPTYRAWSRPLNGALIFKVVHRLAL